MITFISIGASSPLREMNEIIRRYGLRPDKNINLVLSNCCKGGMNVAKMASEWSNYEAYINGILKKDGIKDADVNYIWFKTDDTSDNINKLSQVDYIAFLKKLMNDALNIVKSKFPNAKILLSGRHDGYVEKHAAPRAQYNNEVCIALASERQDTQLICSFYQQCEEGMWDASCVDESGVHPNPKGLQIACDQLENWLVDNTDWFTNKTTEPPVEQPDLQGIYLNPDKPERNVGFHFGAQAFVPVYTQETYADIAKLAGSGGTLPIRFRVFSKEDGSTLGIDTVSIPKVYALLDEMSKVNVTVQAIHCIYEDLTVDQLMDFVTTMQNKKMELIAFEIGNECFSRYSSFEEYLLKAQPLIEGLKLVYPGIPIIFPVAGRPIDSDGDGISNEPDDILSSRGQGTKHAAWNDALSSWLNNQPEWFGVAPHIYPTMREFATMDQLPMEQTVIDGELNQALETFFQDFIADIPNALLHYQKTFDYLDRKFEGRKRYITEFGVVGSDIRNTMAVSMYVWEALNQFFKKAEYWFFHAGISAATSGSKYPAKKIDTKTGLISKLEWLTIELFRNKPDSNIQIEKTLLHGISSETLYAGCGHSAFMNDSSKPGYLEISESHPVGSSYSFGHIMEGTIIIDPPPPTPDEYVEVIQEVVTGYSSEERSIEVEYKVDCNIQLTTQDQQDQSTVNTPASYLIGRKVVTYLIEVPIIEKKVFYAKKK